MKALVFILVVVAFYAISMHLLKLGICAESRHCFSLLFPWARDVDMYAND